MEANVKRKRIVSSKYSRHACRTCRIRRIKCDEGKDSCNNCTSTGRICDGYGVVVSEDRNHPLRPLLPAPTALTNPDVSKNSGSSVRQSPRGQAPSICHYCARKDPTCECRELLLKTARMYRNICPRPSAHSFALNDAEGHALDFFRRITIHQLPCASASETPWELVALDLMHSQPSIAAAACACAALHRALTDGPDHNQYQFALQQYNKSSALMRKFISDLDHDTPESAALVVLAVCLLFFAYETFSGGDAKAAIHLSTGLRIIHERLRPREETRPLDDRNVVIVDRDLKSNFSILVQTFLRLDSDYMLIGHDEPYLYPISQNPNCPTFSNPDEASLYLETITAKIFDVYDRLAEYTFEDLANRTPNVLESLDEDQEICLMRAALRFMKLNQSLQEAVEECKESLHTWTKAFRMVPRTHANLLSHISTQIFFFCVYIWVETWHDVNACLVDRFEPQFAYFTNLCEQYIQLHAAKTPSHNAFVGSNGTATDRFNTPPAFSLGSGVVTCLAAIVEKCRTSSIRRRCIALLRKINLKGVFDTNYLATYLQTIVDHEEQAAQLYNPDVDKNVGFEARDVPEQARLFEVIMSPARHRSRFDFYKTDRVNAVFVTNGNALQLGRLTACVSRGEC